MQIKKSLSLILFICSAAMSCSASIVQINGKLTDDKLKPIYSLEEHFNLGSQLVQEKKWDEALFNFKVITTHFFDSPLYPDSLFFAGVCYYFLEDYQMANRQLSLYLNQPGQLKYFDRVFDFKFHIAESFKTGAKKHLFDFEAFPKLLAAHEEALELYDEVISSLPHQELGARALYGKAELLFSQKKFKESIDALSILIKRFPKDEHAPKAYLFISHVYLDESARDSQNPDLLALAQVNLNHFKRDFPGDESALLAEQNIKKMEEVFAASLYKTGRFYEKKKKPKASLIYYEEAVKRYPETASAEKCKERASSLRSNA